MEHKKRQNAARLSLKNIAIGFLLGVCLMLGMGANGGNSRYQSCAAGDDSSAVFVTDTQTGHTWRLGRKDTLDFGTPHERRSERAKQKTTKVR